MDTLKDLIFRYCVFFGRRFFLKDKISFLKIINKEFMQLGYGVDVKRAKLQLSKRKQHNYYNAYVGNLDKADIIICTYYDTGINTFNLVKTHAFDHKFNQLTYFIGLLPILILFFISLILNYCIFIPNIKQVGFFSVSGILSIISTVLFFFFISKYKNGIPNKKNFVCNTSSILTILNLARKLKQKEKKNIAFVLMDGGYTNQFGLKMLENYSNKITQKKIILLDSIGNGEELLLFEPAEVENKLEEFYFNKYELETTFPNYIMITSGLLELNNKVRISDANSYKDNKLSSERINKHTNSLYLLIQKLLTKNEN